MAKKTNWEPMIAEMDQARESLRSTPNREYIYTMTGRVLDLLQDRDWLLERFGGDSDAARDHLEKRYFDHLCGLAGLGTLLAVRARFPEARDWDEANWNLAVLIAKSRMREPKDGDRPALTRRSVTLKEFEAKCRQNEQLLRENKRLKDTLEAAEARLEAAQGKIKKLKAKSAAV